MIQIIIDVLLILPFFLLGVIPGIKKVVEKLVHYFCLLFGITASWYTGPHSVKTNKEFKELIGVKTVKESKTNIKQKRSIHLVALILLGVCGLLFLLNLPIIVGDYLVTLKLLSLLDWFPLTDTVYELNTFYTAILFSMISFSLSAIMKRWKETKDQRKERKIEKAKQLCLKEVSTKELIEAVNRKEESKKQRIIKK